MRSFKVSLYHGVGNTKQAVSTIAANSPHAAVRIFMGVQFPWDQTFPLRVEHPQEGVPTWSAGTTASGQRVWIRELV